MAPRAAQTNFETRITNEEAVDSTMTGLNIDGSESQKQSMVRMGKHIMTKNFIPLAESTSTTRVAE